MMEETDALEWAIRRFHGDHQTVCDIDLIVAAAEETLKRRKGTGTGDKDDTRLVDAFRAAVRDWCASDDLRAPVCSTLESARSALLARMAELRAETNQSAQQLEAPQGKPASWPAHMELQLYLQSILDLTTDLNSNGRARFKRELSDGSLVVIDLTMASNRPSAASKNQRVVHFAGPLRYAGANGHVTTILSGWAACCTGLRAEQVRRRKAHSYVRTEVTCKACLKAMSKEET